MCPEVMPVQFYLSPSLSFSETSDHRRKQMKNWGICDNGHCDLIHVLRHFEGYSVHFAEGKKKVCMTY